MQKPYERAKKIVGHIVPSKNTLLVAPNIFPENFEVLMAQNPAFTINDFDKNKDYPEVKKIFKSNSAHDPYIDSIADQIFIEKNLRRFEKPFHPSVIKTLKINGKIIGFVMYDWFSSQNYPDVDNKTGPHYIYHRIPSLTDKGAIEVLGVDEEYRKQGAGVVLLNAAIKDLAAHGAKKVYLNVYSDNKPALNSYMKLGFEPIREFKEDNDSFTLMSKDLQKK